MSIEQTIAFEVNLDHELIVRFRYWEDEAKRMNVPVDNINRLT